MIFEYACEKCKKIIEHNAPIGKASKTIICDCGETCERHYGGCNFVLKGPGDHWPSRQGRIKREQTAKNEAAGRRMRKEWNGTQPKLIDQR